jgi:hypothetical protein
MEVLGLESGDGDLDGLWTYMLWHVVLKAPNAPLLSLSRTFLLNLLEYLSIESQRKCWQSTSPLGTFSLSSFACAYRIVRPTGCFKLF